jgi:AAA+ superfamily predicted ATPase
MSQFDYIKEIARYGLENDQERLLNVLQELIDYSKKTKKVNFAIQLQSILKEGLKNKQNQGLTKVGSHKYYIREEDKQIDDLIIEKITSDYNFDNLISPKYKKEKLEFFVKEHRSIDVLRNFDLPVSNKILFYGPSGCGKTLASYVLAGELEKMMYVINLGAIVSSKLGETSKNLARIFRKASSEECILFFDELDSLGKIRDYNQDHGEMKRVVNTILQLFDYLPQETIIIAATNQVNLIDQALYRRFDMRVNLELPNKDQIQNLIDLTLNNSPFNFKSKKEKELFVDYAQGLSYYVIQKILIDTIKRTLFNAESRNKNAYYLKTQIWEQLLEEEKNQ